MFLPFCQVCFRKGETRNNSRSWAARLAACWEGSWGRGKAQRVAAWAQEGWPWGGVARAPGCGDSALGAAAPPPAGPSWPRHLSKEGRGKRAGGKEGNTDPRLPGGPRGSRPPCPHLLVPTPQASVVGPRSPSLATCHSESLCDARPCSARVSRWPGDLLVKADPPGRTLQPVSAVTAAHGHLARGVFVYLLLYLPGKMGQPPGSVWTPPPSHRHRPARTDAQPGVCRPCTARRGPRTAPRPHPSP